MLKPLRSFALAIGLLIGAAAAVSAQGDRVIVEREGQSFFVHRVEQGHTLYSISKLYQTTVEAIEAANPGVGAGLSIGQSLYVPVPADYNDSTWTNPVRIEDGYMIHRVQKKETLYGICREYTVDINRVLEVNPAAEQGIQPGMELRIPKNDLHETPSITAEPPKPVLPTVPGEPSTETPSTQNQVGFEHTVAQGETLYGICRKYGVEQMALLKANGGLPEGLKAGQVILIPLDPNPAGTGSVMPKPLPNVKPSIEGGYNVVVMLPLSLKTVGRGNDSLASPATLKLREIALGFYRGMLLAFDTLEHKGARLNVTLLDVDNSTDLTKLTDDERVKNAHLIVGPLQRKPLEHVAAFAARTRKHVVCPVPQSNALLLKSATLSKVVPSVDSQVRALAGHVYTKHKGENIILINSKEITDLRLVNLFKDSYLSRLRVTGDTTLTGITEIEGSTRFVGDLQTRLSKGRRNVIVVPAGDNSKSMIANLQTKLQLLGRDYNVVLYGLNDWLAYDFLDIEFKERTHLTVPSASFTDYEHPTASAVVDAFRNTYNAEATEYALLGYDVALYYGLGLLYFGEDFPQAFDRIPQTGLTNVRFKLRKTGLDSGYENEHVFLLNHMNYYLQPVGYDRFE
ncbi:MAG: LysM peptidoglycan-binding domain-containing protein [Flavobacteriales bacterium]